ncbi:hypothetical protein ACTFIW_008655 [Dictyostelium discoideum]
MIKMFFLTKFSYSWSRKIYPSRDQSYECFLVINKTERLLQIEFKSLQRKCKADISKKEQTPSPPTSNKICDIKIPLLVGSIPSTVSSLTFHEDILSSVYMEGVQNLTLHTIKSELKIGSILESVSDLTLKERILSNIKPRCYSKNNSKNYFK